MKQDNLWKLTKGQRGRYLRAIGALAVGTVFTYAAPLLAKAAIDALVDPEGASLPAGVAALGMVALTALGACCMYAMGRWSAEATEAVILRLRNRLFDHLQKLPVSFHDRSETGDLVQRCTSDVETIRLFLSAQVVHMGRVSLALVTVVPIMLWLDLPLTLVTLAGLPAILVAGWIFFRKVRASFTLADEAEGELTTVIQENLSGIGVVRAFARQDYEQEKFGRANAEFRDRTFRVIKLLGNYWAFSDILCLGQIATALLVGAHWMAQGRITVGTLFAFLTYANMLIWPLRQTGRTLADLGKATVALGRAQEILAIAEESAQDLHDRECTREPFAPRGGIEVEGLSFSYGTGPRALTDVSFQVEPGETLAIVGPAGAGKSTLVQLLLRLYDYRTGSIRIDGVELRDVSRDTVRDHIAAVLQDPFLYSRTVGTNVRFGSIEADEDDMLAAAQTAHVHDEIEAFDKGYDTLVGERGVTLSGGQRQRLALARALLKDSPILILDDSLSAVDSGTELRIRQALRGRRGRRTSLVIAHRLSTLMDADRVLVLEHGRVTQLGTHEELLTRSGPYRRMWEIQSELEHEIAESRRKVVGLEGTPR